MAGTVSILATWMFKKTLFSGGSPSSGGSGEVRKLRKKKRKKCFDDVKILPVAGSSTPFVVTTLRAPGNAADVIAALENIRGSSGLPLHCRARFIYWLKDLDSTPIGSSVKIPHRLICL